MQSLAVWAWGTLPVAIVFNVAMLTLSLADRHRWAVVGLAAGAALWVGAQLGLAAGGIFSGDMARQVPVIGVVVLIPLVTLALAVAFNPTVRQWALELPMQVLVGLNVLRVFGAFFLLLALHNQMAGPFPYSAGWGDVITGIVAAPLALAIARGRASSGAIWTWTLFGTADLLAAVFLGTITFNGGPGQLLVTGAGSNAIGVLPWSLIPTVLVPFYLATHGITFLQLSVRPPAVLKSA
ncbi:hypothetical protein ABIB57_004213 [Devosia sp. UYZn731]|uniref:hypothetical protein n=1 Tax=Devosia sp. UYZn731 TaxID=3156345 RepID=UPI00339ADE97